MRSSTGRRLSSRRSPVSKQPFQIDDVGSQIKETVTDDSNSFEHALITTYTVTPGYLDWFDGLDTLVCAPSDAAEEIHLSESVDTAPHSDITILERDIHGKCVVVWGPERIVAWVGSFNLSHAGLFMNVEWASRFEGTVTEQFEVADLQAGRLGETLTTNDRITQLLDTVQSVAYGTPAESVDDALRRWPAEPIVVHSGPGNSLRRSVAQCLTGTTGDVTLSYFTPNVNKTGVKALASLAASGPNEQPAVELYGAQPSAVIDTTQPTFGSFVGTEDVRELEAQLDFVLRTRLPGDDGETLPSGSQIRGGLAHLKALVISETIDGDEVIRDVLLTSANLTSNAWEKNGGNIEYGIWLRDPDRIETVGTFFLESLAECYGRADEQTLTDIDERMAAGSGGLLPYTQRTLEDFVTAQLRVSGTDVQITWLDDDVLFDIEQCRWYLRDIVTGELDTKDAVYEPKTGRIQSPTGENADNLCIEALELQVTTPLETPVYELSSSQLNDLERGALDTPIEDWDRILLNGVAYSTDGALPTDSLEAAESAYLYRCHNRSLTRTLSLDADHLRAAGFDDPHLPGTAITDATPTTQNIDALGQLPCVEITFGPGISPPAGSIDFESPTTAVQPVGWLETEHGRQYLFEPATESRSLTVSLGQPFDKHYPEESHDCSLPGLDTPSANAATMRLQQIGDIRPRYSLARMSVPNIPDMNIDVDPFIHEDASIQIDIDDGTLDVDVTTCAYEVYRESYFYTPPTRYERTESFTPPAPYSRLTVQGLISVQTEIGQLWLYTDKATIDVQKRLITSLHASADEIPTALPFDALDQDQAIMWLGFDFMDLTVENVEFSALEDLVFECWRDETKLEQSRPIRALIEPPEYHAIPLFRSLIDESATYRIVVRPATRGTKYAWSASEYEISLRRRDEDTFVLTLDGNSRRSFEIHEDMDAPSPMIHVDRLSKVRLGEELPYHPYLDDSDTMRPETLRQTDETVLRFVERQ